MKPILHTFGLLNAIAVVGTIGVAPYYLSVYLFHYLGWIGVLIYWSLAAYGLVSWYLLMDRKSRRQEHFHQEEFERNLKSHIDICIAELTTMEIMIMTEHNYQGTRLTINEFLLEADVHSLMEHIDSIEKHIKATVPNEVLYLANGELNTRTRWGAVLYHAQSLRVTIRAFI